MDVKRIAILQDRARFYTRRAMYFRDEAYNNPVPGGYLKLAKFYQNKAAETYTETFKLREETDVSN